MASGPPGIINPTIPDGTSVNAGVCQMQLTNDGTYAISPSQTGNWVTPASAVIAAMYQVKVDVNAGSFTSGTVGSFIDLSSTRLWSLNEAAPPSTTTVTFTLTIREKATGIVRSVQAGKTLEATAV
jgi:hypothetical protein